MSAASPAISYIVTCKGRLDQLQQTLPTLVAQPAAECIVVDYDCPQRTGEWVRHNVPQACVVHVQNVPVFNLSHARNLGASMAHAPWLCFVDADIRLAPRFAATLQGLLDERHYYRPAPWTPDASGTALCRADDFRQLGGYDEALEGWGGDDDDLYARLRFLGRSEAGFPADLLAPIAHADAERTAFYAVGDRWRNQRINSFYLHVKFDLMRQLGPEALTLEMRQGIYREIRKTFLANPAPDTTPTRFEITLPLRHETPIQTGWHIQRQWVYQMTPQPVA